MKLGNITMLVLSLFPGIDLFGRGFEAEGYTVVRGPDIILGQDIREFKGLPGSFQGVIGGPPCQDFSRLRRTPPTGEGLEMLGEFCRVVAECRPEWFLMENVPSVPDVAVPGYIVQRLDLKASECGLKQSRLRHFQFGSKYGDTLEIDRSVTELRDVDRAAVASEGRRSGRRSWPDFCELQGLPRDFSLPGWSIAAAYQAVGNGVPVPMGRVLARAVTNRGLLLDGFASCSCGCGRLVFGKAQSALPACRKRLERKRRGGRFCVTAPA